MDLTPFGGSYRSTYWDIDADLTLEGEMATMTITDGLVVSDAGEASGLRPAGEKGWRADGGMFHGFDVALLESGDGRAVSGGLYPFTFRRAGNIAAKAELIPDVGADLNGLWLGTAETPLGPMMLEITVSDGAALVSTPFGRDLPLEGCVARDGHVSGRFRVVIPASGEMVLYPRLVAAGGKLKGPVYAQGWFGEVAFPAELAKA